MNKKEFTLPEVEIINLENDIILTSGHHKGWDNPKNPHYSEEY